MGEFIKFIFRFFHGWQRKVGAVTLVMACVFMLGWIRSFSYCDGYLFLGSDPAFHLVYSVPNRFGWVLVKNKNGSVPMHYRSGQRGRRVRAGFPVSDRPYALIYGPVESGHELAQAFECGPQWSLPYWCVVLPLTACSAFLFFSKPRKSTPKKLVESAFAEGT